MGLYQCLLSESAIQIGKAPFASQEEEYKRVLRGMRPPVRIASYAACGFRVTLPDCSLLVWIRLGTRASIPGPFIFAVHLQTTTNTFTAIAEEKEKIKKMGQTPEDLMPLLSLPPGQAHRPGGANVSEKQYCRRQVL